MKIVLTPIALFLTALCFGQNSFYFATPIPANSNKVVSVDAQYYGEYKDDERSLSYVFNSEGITVTSTNINSIGKKVIRESSTYQVKNDHIFGVVPDDSLPCVLEKGRYYFGVKNSDPLIFGGSKHVLTRIDSRRYIINYFENAKYVPMLIEFDGKSMTMKDFNYDPESTSFSFIQNQEKITENDQNLVILSPTETEFQSLNNDLYFTKSGQFVK